MLHMDDLIEPRPEQILFAVVSCFFGRIVPSDAAGESLFVLKGNHKMKLQGSEPSGPESSQSQTRPWPEKATLDQPASAASFALLPEKSCL
jgi:hypothetical protein